MKTQQLVQRPLFTQGAYKNGVLEYEWFLLSCFQLFIFGQNRREFCTNLHTKTFSIEMFMS